MSADWHVLRFLFWGGMSEIQMAAIYRAVVKPNPIHASWKKQENAKHTLKLV